MSYYIHTDVVLKVGKLPEYAAMMRQLAPFMARNGWKLVHALQAVTGDFRTLVHVWELADFSAVERGLGACASPEGAAILAPMADLVESEMIRIMADAGYA